MLWHVASAMPKQPRSSKRQTSWCVHCFDNQRLLVAIHLSPHHFHFPLTGGMGAGKVDQPEAGRDVPEGDAVQAPTQVRACGAQAAHPLGQAGAEKTATTGLGEVHSAAAKSCAPSFTRHSHTHARTSCQAAATVSERQVRAGGATKPGAHSCRKVLAELCPS